LQGVRKIIVEFPDTSGAFNDAPPPRIEAERETDDVDWPYRSRSRGVDVYARVATFQGDAANVDEAINRVRGEVESGNPPPGLEDAKMLMLINRETGKGVGVTLFEDEDAMRRGDETLNAMDPGAGGRRTGVEFYEVPVHTLG
jgi:hypothetical protein